MEWWNPRNVSNTGQDIDKREFILKVLIKRMKDERNLEISLKWKN